MERELSLGLERLHSLKSTLYVIRHNSRPKGWGLGSLLTPRLFPGREKACLYPCSWLLLGLCVVSVQRFVHLEALSSEWWWERKTGL